jgi:hypothetical protein
LEAKREAIERKPYGLGSWEPWDPGSRGSWVPISIRIGFFAAIFCGGGIQGGRLVLKYLGRKKWIGGDWKEGDGWSAGLLVDRIIPISGNIRIGKMAK